MILNIKHTQNGKKIIALCDENLLGKKIEDNIAILDLSSSFYKGEKKNKTEIVRELNGAYIVNAVGEKCTKLLIELGYCEKKDIKKLSGIPHIQIVFDI